MNRSLACMSICRSRPVPEFTNLCGTPAGTTTTWPPEDIQGIAAPTLLVVGDSDAIRLEHAVEMFRLLGGGAMGDLAGLPESRLVVLPGTAHFIPPGSGVLDRAEWLLAMVPPFLDAPTPEAEPSAGGGA